MPMCPDLCRDIELWFNGLLEHESIFFTHTQKSVRNHFTQGNEPVPDLYCYEEQIPFYQNDNYYEGGKL